MPELPRPWPLSHVLASRLPAVIDRLREHWVLDARVAAELWTDTLRWLWLCARYPERSLTITASMVILDEMWSGLLLSTRGYAAFCERQLGRFLHHQPGADVPVSDPEAARDPIALVHHRLGPEVAAHWFDGYQKRYPASALATRYRRWRAAGGAP